jgi:hypothetical protein
MAITLGDLDVVSSGAVTLTATGANAANIRTNGIDRVVVGSTGLFGINIATPTQRLHVGGNILATGSIDCGTQFLGLSTDSATAPSFSFTGDTDTGMFRPTTNQVSLTTGGTVRLTVTTAQFTATLPWRGQLGTAAAPALSASGDSNTGFFFPSGDFIGFTEGGAECARFTSTGDLLVGTTSNPNACRAVFQRTTAASNVDFRTTLTTATNQCLFVNGNGTVGSINTSGTTTTYNTSSDYRLKEDVQPVANPIDRLMQLKPINFAWKVDGSRTDGFLAHEVQEVTPAAVTGTKDEVDKNGNPVYQGVDPSKLVPLLTAALQDAIKRIEQLESQISLGL